MINSVIKPIKLGRFEIGPERPSFIVAEAGINHNGSLELAHKLVDAAAAANVDAVKFQTFRADTIATRYAPKADYQMCLTDPSESQFEMLRKLELSREAHVELMNHCRDVGILFMSTPFDEESADLLEVLGIEAFKIPSGELTNLAFLAHVAGKHKPMIIATGMAHLCEVESAVFVMEDHGNTDLILLHCVSNYPAYPTEVNLRAILTLNRAFRLPVGYSDHTLGNEVALAAIALGACVLEKHFTLDRGLPGPDHQVSAEPAELSQLVKGIRTVEKALGDGRKRPCDSESKTANMVRRSLVAAVDILEGTILSEELIALKRPGTGLPPAVKPFFIGRKSKNFILAGTMLSWEMVY